MRTAIQAPRILSDDQLRTVAPSIFAAQPWERMSERYKMVPTAEVLDILRGRGFQPVTAGQNRCRIEGKGSFTKHMIRLRHEDYLSGGLAVGAEIPEMVLTNSHDGTSAYQFAAGIFRLICLNGMTVQSSDFGNISVRHSGKDDFQNRIIDATYEVVEQADRTMDKVAEWKQIQLSPPQREAFAAAVLEVKGTKTATPAQVVQPRRSSDHDANLWVTANVIQENVMRGGIRGFATTGRRTTTRPVKSVSEDLRINKAIWTLTEKMAELAS
jgi:hypothetical protein